jgi:hypothetical protein
MSCLARRHSGGAGDYHQIIREGRIVTAASAAASRKGEHSQQRNRQQRKKINPLSHQKSPVGFIV